MSYVVIVESPGKIKKIGEYLGNDYIIMASVGHIMDLLPNKMSIDLGTFEPEYTIYPDKEQVVSKLQKQIQKIGKDNVFLASDEDREGEMIAWSLAQVLKLKDPKRIVFNSITKKELQTAVQNPIVINQNMVYAQQARRILDRLCGYIISPILSKVGFANAKSAGRVQSVVVKLIVEKEAEITKFYELGQSSYFTISGIVTIPNFTIKMSLFHIQDAVKEDVEELDNKEEHENAKVKFNKDQEELVVKLLKNLVKATYSVLQITTKTSKSNPSPPYTTSSLQQDASRKCGFDSKHTMAVAQKLYQDGHITYMRTDSTNISPEASNQIKKYIVDTYSDPYYKFRDFKNKKNNTQEAHECIRPTKITYSEIDDTPDAQKLYKLIWKRTVQSQMAASETQNIIIELQFDKKVLKEYKFVGTLSQLLFEGYLILDNKKGNSEIEAEQFKNNTYEWKELYANEETTKPPVRYNEASLINKLDPKNLNIGRPSTYATILEKIHERKYVVTDNLNGTKLEVKQYSVTNKNDPVIEIESKKIVIGKETKKIIPTELGIKLTEYLNKTFTKIMDYAFTAEMEQKLDDIAEGKCDKLEIIKPFYEYIQECMKHIAYAPKEKLILGQYNDTDIVVSTGKFGKYITCGAIKFSIENMDQTLEAVVEKINKLNQTKSWTNNKLLYILQIWPYGKYITEWTINKKTNDKKKIKNHNIKSIEDTVETMSFNEIDEFIHKK